MTDRPGRKWQVEMNDHCENWREQIRRRIDGGLAEDGIQLDSHIDQCEICRQYQQALLDDHQQLAGYTASLDDVVARIEHRVIKTLAGEADPTDQQGMAPVIPLRRRIMNMIMTRYGAAAAVLLAVVAGFGVLNQMNDTGVAWADVLEQVTAAQSVTYKGVTGVDGPSAEITIRTAADHTAVYDIHVGEKLFMCIFYDPDEQAMITLMPGTKQYTRKKLTREEYREHKKSENPSYLLERLFSFEHTDLGTREIDGVMAVGIESDDPRLSAGLTEPFSMRLWADVKTNWPVRVEMFRRLDDGGEVPMSTLSDFRWNEDPDPVAFTLDIPADYQFLPIFGESAVGETQAMEGLDLYATHMGNYPKHLAAVESTELMETLRTLLATMSPEIDPKKETRRAMEQVKPYINTCLYHNHLTQEQRDVAWYGGEVMPGDEGKVLWRWRQDDGNYRVIYGDLTAETVSPELLKQLEIK